MGGSESNAMKPITGWKTRQISILVCMVILTGCTLPPPSTLPFSCSSFTESFWEAFRFGVDTPDNVVSTAARLWEIEREHVEVALTASGEVSSVRWRSIATVGPQGKYLAWFRDDQTLGKISVNWGNPRPTFSETVDCLGLPDHYIAFYYYSGEAKYLSLSLLYMGKRTIIRHDNPSWSGEALRIHPDMRMDRFIVVAYGSAEQAISDLYSYGYEVASEQAQALCLLKPWPGSIEAMEIASNEEWSRCGVFP